MALHIEVARMGRGECFVLSVGYTAKKLASALVIACLFTGVAGAKVITPTIPSPPGGGWTSYSPPSNWGTVPVSGFCSEVGMISGYIGGVFAGCFDSGSLGGGGWGGRGPITEPVGGGNEGGGGGPAPGGTNVAGRNADQKLPCKNNPIIISTGNKIEPEGDFSTSGEMALALARTYNHYWSGVGLFGKNWVSNFDYKLTFGTTDVNSCYPRPGGGSCTIGSSTTIYAWRPDGRVLKFIKRTDGAFYEDKPEAIAKIIAQADGSLVLTTEENKTETYSSAGYISKIQDFKNISWTFSYTSGTYPSRVTHTSGRFVEFIWTNGQLTAVRDPAGSSYGFTYTANQFGTGIHRLASSTKPASPSTVITY